MVANAGKILHTTTADHDDRVLLEVMAFAGNVARHLEAVRQTHARNLTQRLVRLLRGRSIDPGANTELLRASMERRKLDAGHLGPSTIPAQSVYRRQRAHRAKT